MSVDKIKNSNIRTEDAVFIAKDIRNALIREWESAEGFVDKNYGYRSGYHHYAFLMEKGAQVLGNFPDHRFLHAHQGKLKGVFLGVAAVFVKIAAVDQLDGKGRLVALAYVLQNGQVLFGTEFLVHGLGIVEPDINGVLESHVFHSLPFDGGGPDGFLPVSAAACRIPPMALLYRIIAGWKRPPPAGAGPLSGRGKAERGQAAEKNQFSAGPVIWYTNKKGPISGPGLRKPL